MARVAVIGEPLRIYGYGLAGAVLRPASGRDEALAAWRDLPDDIAVAVLTPGAARWLADEIRRAGGRAALRAARHAGPRAGAALMTQLTSQDAALEPVRQAMLRRAAERAAQIVSQARAAADAELADARQAADAELARARASGIAQAEPVAAAELNRSRRAARSVALGAALTAHDKVAERIRVAVLALRDEPEYPRLRDALAARARRAAGPRAEITEHPAGGVIARAGGITVDCSLPRLADRAVEALGPGIAWVCGS